MTEETIELTTKYRLVLLDDQSVEVGTVTALNLNPQSVLVVMPPNDERLFTEKAIEQLTNRFDAFGIRVLVLPSRVSFVRLEQVSE